jgi:hypothetical protein
MNNLLISAAFQLSPASRIHSKLCGDLSRL